ncbi:50S ribosomal protein L28 [Tepiditoga spiralis]|uniref:Large ribosomal subunit protein bL28 n=1 Tax=Tepiditoga spiralis TaxID=2108365 RepID=A0A7G1G5V1_9BACT|nr:50S ribosomal protein L28 [Tepiditoga spiralis]BBE30434.1 50S ribosomal protein L28 [Tepiditoga spiralis]
MSKKCDICGKGPVANGQRSGHSLVSTRRWWKPNIQRVRAVMSDGSVKRVHVCTDCLRAGKIKRA